MRSCRPTARGVVLLVAALVALLVAGRYDVTALRPVSGLLLGLVVLGLAAAFLVPRRLTVERSMSSRLLEHDAVGAVRLTVTNRSPVQALDLRWRALLPDALGGPVSGPVGVLGPARTSSGSVRTDVAVAGAARGRHRLGPLLVDVRDPFGVVVRRRRIEDDIDVVVLPRRVPLRRLSSFLGSGADGGGLPSARRHGDGEDDVISRSYQPGDAPKRIDWRTTARRGELMVRQDEPSTADRVSVAVEQGTEPGPAEWALVAGASAIAHLAAAGHAVATVVPGTERRTVTGRQDSLQLALTDLAELSHLDRAEVGVAPVDGRPVVAVLGVVDVRRAEEWTSALRRSERVLALVAADSGEAVLGTFRASGWRVVAWDEADEVEDRWASLGSEGANRAEG